MSSGPGLDELKFNSLQFELFCVVLAQRLPARKPREDPPERRPLKNKQCKKVILPQDSNLQPLDYRSTALPVI